VTDWTVATLARAIAARKISPVEATQEHLARIERLDGRIRAFITVDAEGALAAARALEAELIAGRSRGPLHGVPLAVKDLVDVAGAVTGAGSSKLAGNLAARDAEVVVRLRAAGAVVVGKTRTHEFAYGVLTPGTVNPWDETRIAGGSSGGSAAAVAAGLVPAAIGTDTAGSVRIPAACCGVVGFKPTVGRIPGEGVFEFSRTLDHVGVFAKSVRSAGLLAAILAGETERAPHADDERVPRFAALRTSEWEHASDDMRERFQADVDALAAVGGQRRERALVGSRAQQLAVQLVVAVAAQRVALDLRQPARDLQALERHRGEPEVDPGCLRRLEREADVLRPVLEREDG